jgi:hypothetical protein
MLKAIAATAVLILTTNGGPPAFADFVRLTAPRTASQPDLTPAPVIPPRHLPLITATPPPAMPLHARAGMPINLLPPNPGVPIAHGFGHCIPLSFAVQQIVPPRLHVTYANSVDPSARVTWSGGQAWTVVLEQAVHPLGLRVRVFTSTVTIYR